MTQRLAIAYWGATMAGLASLSCRDVAGGSAEVRSREQKMVRPVSEILEVLLDMPCWSEVGHYDQTGRCRMTGALQRISEFPLNDIRAAMEEYIRRSRQSTNGYDVCAMSRLYVLNKYLFRIPEQVPRSSAKFFGGWMGIPYDDEHVSMAWPVSETSNGERAITGVGAGFMGGEYQALAAFDYYRATFGTRFP